MNRSTDSRDFSEKQPSSVDSNDSGAPMAADLSLGDNDSESNYEVAGSEDHDFQESYQDDYQEPYNEDYQADYRADYQSNYQANYDSAGPTYEAGSIYEQADIRTPRQTRRRHTSPSGFLSGLAVAVGALAAIAGIAATILPEAAEALNGLIAPETITLVGLAIFVFATSHRRTSKMQHRLLENEIRSTHADKEMQDTLIQITRRQSGFEFDNGESPDLQQMMLALQRQDQKVNNLTKAMKMYGNPLMEIASQSAELAGSSAQIKALIENGGQSTTEAISQIEKLIANSGGLADSSKLSDQLGTLQASLESMSQQPHNPEVGKGILRIEDAIKNLSMQMQKQQSSGQVTSDTAELQQTLQKAIAEVSNDSKQMHNNDNSKLEQSVREIQRDLTSLAAGMSQIQTTLANNAQGSGHAPRTTPNSNLDAQPAETAPIEPNQSAPRKIVHGKSSSCLSNKTDENGYSTGPRKTSGKNVLGSIAKLKQMKG